VWMGIEYRALPLEWHHQPFFSFYFSVSFFFNQQCLLIFFMLLLLLLLCWVWAHCSIYKGYLQSLHLCRFEMLRAGFKGSRLRRPENWLVRQLTDLWGKPIHKVGFIREKWNATDGAVQRTLETSSSLLGWRLELFMDTLTLG
jgi:hypothetical protein